MKVSRILGLVGMCLFLGAGASAQVNPFGREIRLTPRIDDLGAAVAELTKKNASKIRGIGGGGYNLDAVYGIEMQKDNLKYEIIFTDRRYFVGGINSHSIGPNDVLELRISDIGGTRYRFIDRDIDGILDFSEIPYEERIKINSFDIITRQERITEIYQSKLLESLLVFVGQGD